MALVFALLLLSVTKVSTIDDLPDDIIFNILHRLPVKLLLQCRTVSKIWRKIIDDPSLATMQTSIAAKEPMLLARSGRPTSRIYSYSIKETQESRIVQTNDKPIAEFAFSALCTLNSYCNGLLCFVKYDSDHQVFVCNPLKPDVMVLPPLPSPTSKFMQIYGLGFCASTHEYKVIRILDDFSSQQPNIHTLGTGSWRHIPSVPPYPIFGKPVFANRALYWKIDTCLVISSHRRTEDRIVLFDMEKEVFEVAKVPVELGTKQNHFIFLTELKGQLGVVDCSFDTHIDIWVLKENKHWTRGYRIKMKAPVGRANNRHIKVLCHWGDDEIFLSSGNDAYYLYNPKTDKMRYVHVSGIDPDATIMEVFNHTWSIASVNGYQNYRSLG